MTGNIARKYAFRIVVCGVIVIAVVRGGQRLLDPLYLTGQARKVVEIHDGAAVDGYYSWLSNQDAIYYRYDAPNVTSSGSWTTVNVNHRTKTPLGALASYGPARQDLVTVRLSPDRSWILWENTQRSTNSAYQQYTIEGASLNGRQRFRFDGQGLGSAEWVGQDRWAECIWNTERRQLDRLRVHRIGLPTTVRPYEITPTHPRDIRIIRATAGGRLFLDTRRATQSAGVSHITVIETSLKARLEPVRSYDIDWPPAFRFAELAVSPQGDRVLLKLQKRHAVPLVLGWLQGVSRQRIVSDTTVGLYEARLGQSGVREVARWETFAEFHRDTEPHSIQWLPDGKQASFILGGALWTIPVR